MIAINTKPNAKAVLKFHAADVVGVAVVSVVAGAAVVSVVAGATGTSVVSGFGTLAGFWICCTHRS